MNYNAAEFPQGVPNPNYPDVNLYPTYEHGPDYTRPVFGMPWMRMPYNVLSGIGAEDGLFAEHKAKERAAFAKGVGAAAGVGILLAFIAGPMGRKPKGLAMAAVSFGLVGAVGAGVTYSTWPRVGI